MARIQLQQAWSVGLLLLLLIQSLQPSNCEMGSSSSSSRISSISSGTADGTEEWGYTDVRPGAHMFWWLYYSKIILQTDVPLVLWIQGGPGASGVGFGNFQEVGPLTTDLEPRESTWLNVAHLLFVVHSVFLILCNLFSLCKSLRTLISLLFNSVTHFFGLTPESLTSQREHGHADHQAFHRF
jgi:hypothetical protein